MTFWKKNHPMAAIRVECKIYGVNSYPTYIIDTLDNIKTLIQDMENNPKFFIEQYSKEEPTFVKKRIKFKIKRITKDEQIEHENKDIPVLAVTNYVYKYSGMPIGDFPWFSIFFILPITLIVGFLFYSGLVSHQMERDFNQTPCTLFIEKGKPIGVQIYGENLHYDVTGHISNPIWEGTATHKQLQMAYEPIKNGCIVVHLD